MTTQLYATQLAYRGTTDTEKTKKMPSGAQQPPKNTQATTVRTLNATLQ